MVNILVVRQKNNQLGDTICTLPMFYALKKKFPDSYIALLRGPVNYDLQYKKVNPYLDEVFVIDRQAPFKEKKELVNLLRSKNFNFGIVPSTLELSTTAHIVNYLSGAKKRVGLSYQNDVKNQFGFLLNVKKKFDWDNRKISQAMRAVEIVEQIGCTITTDEVEALTIDLGENNFQFAENFVSENFDKDRLLVGIHPGGKMANRWNAKYFTEVIEELAKQKNAEVLITSGDIDKDIVEELAKMLTEKNIKYAIAQSLDIKDLSAIMRKFDLYISNDTGILHLASLNHVKTIGLFGPTSSNEWRPIGKNTHCLQAPTDDINSLKSEVVLNEALNILKN
ncbi:MAG: glycosyltransferase family 9 protein [Ignavibacteria bacterium]|nr:glycosyltransferase family 9 protein [Ignavibacteria bacterium]